MEHITERKTHCHFYSCKMMTDLTVMFPEKMSIRSTWLHQQGLPGTELLLTFSVSHLPSYLQHDTEIFIQASPKFLWVLWCSKMVAAQEVFVLTSQYLCYRIF